MRILQSSAFKKAVKKLHSNQKQSLDHAVRQILSEPGIGQAKLGDLAGVRVHKFKIVGQLTLLAYEYDVQNQVIRLLALGSHENFYRDLKS